MKKYDFVIIGSGLGGLCAAIILAKENKKVLVLEQHFKPGGYLHSFKRHGWQFETGFHFSPELGSSQILQMYWQYLGVLDKIELVPYNREHFHSLRFPDFHLDLHSGIDSLQELLNKTFPDEKKAIDLFLKKITELKRYFVYFNRDHIGDLDKEHASFEVSVMDFLNSIGASEKLKAVLLAHSYLYGVPPSETPLGTHAIFFNALYSSTTDIKGGGDALCNALVESLKENGGEIAFRKKVVNIKTENKKIRGVVTEDEDYYECDSIIFSANPKLAFSMFDENPFRSAYTNRIMEMENTSSHFGGYIATSADLSHYKHDVLYFPSYNIDDIYNNPASALPKDSFMYFTVPTARLGRTPDGKDLIETISVDTYNNYQQWSDSKFGKRPQEYKDFKAKIQENVMRQLELHIPEIAGKVDFVDSSTPLTNEHFTNSPQGSIFGIKHNMEQMRAPIRAKTKLDGGYYTGQSLIFPGSVGVTITSFVTCSDILGQQYLFDKIDKETR